LRNIFLPKIAIPIRHAPNSNIAAGSGKEDDILSIWGIAKAAPVMKKIAKNKNNKIFSFIFCPIPFYLIARFTRSAMSGGPLIVTSGHVHCWFSYSK